MAENKQPAFGEDWFNERDRLKDKYGEEAPVEKVELPEPTEERKEEAKDIKKEAVDAPVDFGKISNIGYLYDIFSPKFDKYGSAEYIRKTQEQMMRDGYPETPTLNEFLFWITISRRLHIVYQEVHTALAKKAVAGEKPEDLGFLKEMQNVVEKITKLQHVLDAQKEKSTKIRDVVDLHAETMGLAEQFLREHAGEFSFMDSAGNICGADAQAHWAFIKELTGDGEVQYSAWSEELMYLFKKKLIPLAYVAFTLRTSPEGLKWMAKLRKEKLPKFDIVEEEKKLRDLMLEFEDKTRNG